MRPKAQPPHDQEHVWLSLMPWWHAAFAGTLLATAAWGATELEGSWRLPCVLGLYVVLAVAYVLTPGKFGGKRGSLIYLSSAFVIFTAADFVFPGTGFLLFILVPHCFMMLRVRPALIAAAGLTFVGVGAGLAFSGVSGGTVASVSVFGVMSMFFSLLLGGYISRIIDQSRQRAILIDELERTRAELADLSRKSGALAERERLAGEIHDALAQGFTSVIMLLQAAQASVERSEFASVQPQLGLAEAAARDGLAEARSLIEVLAPLPLRGASLVGAVERVCAELGPRFGFAAWFDVDGVARELSHNAEIVLLRAAQVALVNVGRHSEAGSASVRLVFTERSAGLEVSDRGVGFDVASTAGFGLSQLRSRVADLGGTAEIISAPGEGTTVRVTLPVLQPAPTPSPAAGSTGPSNSGATGAWTSGPAEGSTSSPVLRPTEAGAAVLTSGPTEGSTSSPVVLPTEAGAAVLTSGPTAGSTSVPVLLTAEGCGTGSGIEHPGRGRWGARRAPESSGRGNGDAAVGTLMQQNGAGV